MLISVLLTLPALWALPASSSDGFQEMYEAILPSQYRGLSYTANHRFLQTFDPKNSWEPSKPDDARAPCPMLNTLANHNILPHSGRKISKQKLMDALSGYLLLDAGVSSFLADQALKASYEVDGVKYFDLDALQKHNFIEHDASLSRLDTAVGNNTVFNPEVFAQITNFTEDDGEYLSLTGLARYRRYREATCKATNPSYDLPFQGALGGSLEAAVAYFYFRDSTNKIHMPSLTYFFENERLPFDLGWEPRNVTLIDFMKGTAKVLLITKIGFL